MTDFISIPGFRGQHVWTYFLGESYPTIHIPSQDRYGAPVAILFDPLPTIQIEAIVNARNGSLECGAMARSLEPLEEMTQLIEQSIEAAHA